MANSPYVVTVTAENFHTIVLEGSLTHPVLVDFWADWCAPCRMLMPVLAKLADEYAGKFIVAKVNTEEERELAAQYGIRSLPTVQLFRDGQPVDQFMGALPESEVRKLLDRHLPHESDKLLEQARTALRGGDLDVAAALVAKAGATDPRNEKVQIAEASIKAAAGDTEGADELLRRIPLELQGDPEVRALKGQVRFANLLADAPPEADLFSRLEEDPADSEARYRIAVHRVARGDYEGALSHLLELLKRDRAYGDDAARKDMLMIFDLLGGEGDLVTRYRSRMLNALY